MVRVYDSGRAAVGRLMASRPVADFLTRSTLSSLLDNDASTVSNVAADPRRARDVGNGAMPTLERPWQEAERNGFSRRSFSGSIDTQTLLSENHRLAIQVSSMVVSFVSLCCALVTVFWFVRMKKRFRHKLVVMLILADILRSFWLLVFPIVYLARGGIKSSSRFCQASGFLTQTGIETADFAILCIAIHTALQVFQPTLTKGPDGGLYRLRYFIYASAIILPPTLSSLAFIRSSEGYLAQGPTCSLPIRPYWYRLAISWIPRYTIMLAILVIYIGIYIKVKRHFGSFQFSLFRTSKRLKKVDLTLTKPESKEQPPPPPAPSADLEAFNFHNAASMREWQERINQSETGSAPLDNSRAFSGVTTLVDGSCYEEREPTVTVQEPWMSSDMPHLHGHGFVEGPVVHAKPAPPKPNPKIRNSRAYSNALIGKQLITSETRKRQDLILRHVKLLFVYPLVYFALWVVPFIQHAFNYNNERAQHPLFGMALASSLCISSLGTADSIIFCLREKPWKHIPASDNTFWGSFIFWRALNPDNIPSDSQTEAPTMTGSWSQRNPSSLSDRDPDTTVSASRHASLRAPLQAKRLSQMGSLTNVEEENVDPTDRNAFAARDFADDTPAASQTSAGSQWTAVRPSSHTRTPTREWFDRRLSVAVGRTALHGTDAYDDRSPSSALD